MKKVGQVLPAAIALLLMGVVAPLHAQSLSQEKRTALEKVDELTADIERIARTLWDYSETALLEYQSAEFLSGLLEAEGFTVERGVAGMPTAFVASYGTGSPVIGVLAEFDALPGVGNAPLPRKELRADGIKSGQGCGHNLFGAGSVGGAIAIKRAIEALGLDGTIRLYGTPAEETVVGKVYMANAGLFDGLDAAIEWHPYLETEVNNNPGLAMNNFTVEFFGQAAHSAADPWNGRSALDAVEHMNHGVNLMREHIKPSTRIHYVIPAAGEAPNVVPDYAKVWYYVRDTTRAAVEEYYDWILKIAEGAALATRTTHEVTLITGVHENLLNRPLQVAVMKNLEIVGTPEYQEEDQQFARELQSYLGIEVKGLDLEIKPLADEPEPASGGSTDVAEVSYLTPTVGFYVTSAAAGVPWHSWATSASHGTDGAARAADVAARVIALTGMDMLTDPELMGDARAFFDEKRGGEPYRSPIPRGQKPPLPGNRNDL